MNALQCAIQAVNDDENSGGSYQIDLSEISTEARGKTWTIQFIKNITKLSFATVLLSVTMDTLDMAGKIDENINKLAVFLIG